MIPDIIGTIYKPTGIMLTDSEGNEYPEMQATTGYHVNTVNPVEDWEQYKVSPLTPHRVYAGLSSCFCYMFPDKETFDSLYQPPENTGV